MVIPDLRAILAALSIAAVTCAAAGWQGYRMGVAAETARQNAALLAEVAAGQKIEEQRRQIAQERDDLARQLEEEANASPIVVDHCLGPERVQRLNRLR